MTERNMILNHLFTGVIDIVIEMLDILKSIRAYLIQICHRLEHEFYTLYN